MSHTKLLQLLEHHYRAAMENSKMFTSEQIDESWLRYREQNGLDQEPKGGLPALKEPILTDEDVKACIEESPQGCVWAKVHPGIQDGVYNMKVESTLNNTVMRGAGLVAGGEVTLITFLNKTTFSREDIAQDGVTVYVLDETTPTAHPREDAAGSVNNTTWGPDEYPDLSSCTAEQKHETITGLVQVAAKEIMRMFYAFGLKTHIECTVVNEPTNETFEFSFVKVADAAGSGKEEVVDWQAEIDRRNKIIEDDLKRQMRLNMPIISTQEQEATWEEYKKRNNL